ncbi:HprK-related kinase A [Aliiglaciecola sp. CAU 1673]|uniref:HprK-related kinase A n=1 Tax=Aliiglaciecola sp. CAU 1673 TaxID=3032595 RepID=UPI0023DB7FE9|nr:HprK-related kinase A [Aliiglaciecola sp. CAU 1673]MDF2177327.1 HprK-related kinase A [Aliiglaciecola sp. CAU 1673]
MILGTLAAEHVRHQLNANGIALRVGRFNALIQSDISQVSQDIMTVYADAEVLEHAPIDFHIQLLGSGGFRRVFRPQVNFYFHGHAPFLPLPIEQSLPLMEWGLNWCVSQHYHRTLVVHAAVVEKYGKALILPGQPGAGKSTLCASLVASGGFRLLSDELTLIELESGNILPNPRPISLKNKAIDIIRPTRGQLNLSRVVHDTQKGSVGLLQPPAQSVAAWNCPASPGLVVFPRFNAQAEGGKLQALDKGHALMQMANQCFNYSVLAEQGFKALANHLEQARTFSFEYDGNLEAAIDLMDEMLHES